MSSAPTADEIWRDATWLAQALDPKAGLARLVAMDREAYRVVSFLDDRMLQKPMDAHIVPWPQIEEAMFSDLRHDARWIFHIGHVGSTLVSRLLGEVEGVLAVREPRLLRDLAISPLEVRGRYIASVPKLMSRTFAAEEIACVKATSLVSEIAPELVPPGERALFMFARPRNYVASILAGENSVKELRILETYRVQRLARRQISLPPARNDAERAAAAWACEMTSLEAAAAAMTDCAIFWADFDAMLANMVPSMQRTAAFFGFDADPDRLSTIAAGPLMGRYSKALEYEYTPSLRQELIADATRRHAREIDLALVMLGDASEKHELIAQALNRAEGRA
jgi:hypothetical protein